MNKHNLNTLYGKYATKEKNELEDKVKPFKKYKVSKRSKKTYNVIRPTENQFAFIVTMCKQEFKKYGWEPFAWIRIGTLSNMQKRMWFKLNKENTRVIEIVSWKWNPRTQSLEGTARRVDKYWIGKICGMLKDPSFQLEIVSLGKEK